MKVFYANPSYNETLRACFTAGNQSTVFPLHSCDDYEYVSVTGDNKEFNKEFFDNENWYIRLLMEAEDRMAYSQSKISTNQQTDKPAKNEYKYGGKCY